MKLIYSKSTLFAVGVSLLTLLQAEMGAQTKPKPKPDPKPEPEPVVKCLDLVIGGGGAPRKGSGIFDPVGKGQGITLKSRNCRAISTGIWVKNLCCDKNIWVKLRGTKGDRFLDVKYQFEGKNVTGTITRGNLNVNVAPCTVVDGRIRITCVRGKVRAKRKLKKVLINGFVVGDPFDRDGVILKGKFL